MATISGQKFIGRNRPPRVQIEYEVERYGSRTTVSLPFVVGVMAGLSGANASVQGAVADRKFKDINASNFDAVLKGMQPRVTFSVPNRIDSEVKELEVNITFESMSDFSPAAVARKIPTLRNLLDARTALKNLLTYMDGKPEAFRLIADAVQNEKLMEAVAALSESREPMGLASKKQPPTSAEQAEG